MTRTALLIVAGLLLLSPSAHAASSHAKAPAVARDAHGRIARSQAAKDAFKHANPCPANGHTKGACPGYVIDHRAALACGGLDAPENMQWQTLAEGKAKDKIERRGC